MPKFDDRPFEMGSGGGHCPPPHFHIRSATESAGEDPKQRAAGAPEGAGYPGLDSVQSAEVGEHGRWVAQERPGPPGNAAVRRAEDRVGDPPVPAAKAPLMSLPIGRCVGEPTGGCAMTSQRGYRTGPGRQPSRGGPRPSRRRPRGLACDHLTGVGGLAGREHRSGVVEPPRRPRSLPQGPQASPGRGALPRTRSWRPPTAPPPASTNST
jgi:hypothetical protein